jgi:hypothetical protein
MAHRPSGPAACNFSLANAGGANHQDVLGRDFTAQVPLNLLSSPTVSQGNGYSALGLGLPNDVFVEFGNDFLRSHIKSIYCGKALHLAGAGPSSSTSTMCCMLV